MITNFIRRCLRKLYLIAKDEAEKSERANKETSLKTKAIIGGNTIVSDEAIIQNDTNSADKIVIGSHTLISGYLLVFNHSGEIIIGNNVFVGPGTRIWSAKKILIGNRVLISHNVNIHDNNAHPLESSKRHEDFLHIFNKGLQFKNDLSEKEIIIEDDVWIGFNSTILKGVRIGRGAIIGANCLITKDVPPFAVIVNRVSNEIIRYTS